MTEKLWKIFPTITEGFKEVLQISGSLWQSIGGIDIPEKTMKFEDNFFNHSVVEKFLFNAIDCAGNEGVLTCKFKTTEKGFIYFQYVTSGNLGFSFQKYKDNRVLFFVWKVNPSPKRQLTQAFSEANWRKSWRWALIVWWFETWQKIREPRTYRKIYLRKWFSKKSSQSDSDFDEDVPF